MKKKRIALIALFVVLVVSMASIFVGCKKIVPSQSDIDYIKTSIDNSLKETTYTMKEREVVSRLKAFEHQLMVVTNTADSKLTKAKYVDIVDNVVSSDRVTAFYGTSLKSGIKPKKAVEADYKTGSFYDFKDFKVEIPAGKKAPAKGTYDYKDGKEYFINKCRMADITLDDFLKSDNVKNYNVNSFLEKVEDIADAKWDMSTISIVKQGWVSTYRFKNIGKELAQEFGFKLVDSKGVEKTEFSLVLEITKGRISMVTDSKEDPSKTYSIAYGAADFSLPNWDKTYTDADLAK